MESLKRSTDDILLYDGPGDLLHRTDLHAEAFQGVVIALPTFPLHSNGIESFISPPTINPIWIYFMTITVPECPQVFSGTVSIPGVLVFVKGGETHSIVITQGVS